MENKNSKIIIIILTILVIGLSVFIVYDKVLSKDEIKETETNKENENIEEENKDLANNDKYTFNDFASTVFQKNDDSGDNYLILWKNGTYSYKGTLGNFIVDNNTIRLNYIFENNQKVLEEKFIELSINSTTELTDTNENITLVKVNHPTNPGEFYEIINK